MKLFSENVSWHKANFHMHTTLSDGKKTPEEAIEIYRSHGYDILTMTDHRISGLTKIYKDYMLIGSIECDVMPDFSQGNEECYHILGLGVPEGYYQKWSRTDTKPETVIEDIRAHGGFTVLAHPAWSLNTAEDILKLEGIDAIEIYNSVSNIPNNPERADSSAILDPVFNRGKLFPLFASDDTHWYKSETCYSATMIQTDDFTPKGVFEAIKKGKSYATTGPLIKQIEVTSDTLHVECSPCVGACIFTNHPWVKGAAQRLDVGTAESFDFSFGDNTTFIRVMVLDPDGRKAWSNPVAPEQ